MIDDALVSDGTFTVTNFTSDRAMTCTTTPVPGIGVPIDQVLQVSCTLNEALAVNDEWNLTITVTADETQTLNNVADVELNSALDPDFSQQPRRGRARHHGRVGSDAHEDGRGHGTGREHLQPGDARSRTA